MKKTALVIGGSGGIGFASTKRLLEDGLQVCSTYNTNVNKLKLLRKEVGTEKLLLSKCNVNVKKDVKRTVDELLVSFEQVDVVVVSVTSKLTHSRILDLDWNEYNKHIELQIKSLLFIMKSLEVQIRSKKKIKFIVILKK